ncbi:ABC transporter substrate-binding protein [Saccharothrix violaceirubra]|uniref:ABC-type nitrate/sulfonate/bicarbonate transport system substrate-binding protein n=1 Tax=Saccharothrix violaceirubra TaxID=413306 RepID=A0A7W7T5M2_9PSEU|nr:ABC transporter substrate-binding protein [Saccharothrix violaceirubra]MBB4966402.1 ABC-type nitrate/sulfonate/bicarbonate transport system substrate-binding protein [Saccharothrix violaceirubra]
MTSTRRDFLALSLLGLATAAVGCGTAAGGGGEETKTLRYQGSVGQVTPAELAADLGYLGDIKLEWVGNTISGPQDIQSAATGQIEFGGAFNGAVVKLAAAGAPIQAVIGYYGVDKDAYSGFFVAEDSPIRSPRDLIGKKVGMNTLGAHSEAMLGIYLQRAGLSREEIKGVEALVVPPVNTEQSLRQKQIDVGVLGGVFRDKALAAGGIRPLFTDFELQGAFTAGSYVLTKKFIQQNPNTVRTFVTGVGKALDWTRATPRDQVVARFTEIVKKRGRNEDTATLQLWKSFGVAGTGGRLDEKDFSIWLDWLSGRDEVKKDSVKTAEIFTNDFNGAKS